MLNELEYQQKMQDWKSRILSTDSIDDEEMLQRLTQRIENEESHILSLGAPNYPKVDHTTITSRHQYYNLLDFNWPEMEQVKHKIRKNAIDIIGGEQFLVKMWANIFRKGQRIDKHIHHPTPIRETEQFKTGIFKTICGHLFLYNDHESHTIYYMNNQRVPVLNTSGEMHFFSCIVEHETEPFQGTKRVGLAFDIYTMDFFKTFNIPIPRDVRPL